jgi:hypothetical protein
MTSVLFVLGDTRVRRGYNCFVWKDCCTGCYTYSCNLQYQIRDQFERPLDYIPWEPGTPYAMNADWSDQTCGFNCPRGTSLPIITFP